jgi:hypothetical protein
LSGLREQVFHCCVNSCCCFTGPFADDTTCPICSEPRLDSRKRPRNLFRYIPLIPRLKAYFQNPQIIELLKYRHKREPFDGTIRDVFDSIHFLNLLDKFVTVEDKTFPYKFGEHEYDLFLGLMLDGVALFKGLGARQSKNNYSCWPLEIVVYSLPPTIRTQLHHCLSLGVIPGPREPKHLNSFLHPLYIECVMGAQGVPTWISEGSELRRFDLHFYLIFGSGDIKALQKVRCTKGPNAISPCHACPIKGIRDPNRRNVTTHYVPHTRPGHTSSQVNHLLQNPRTHEEYLKYYEELEDAPSKKEEEKIAKETGISGIPILSMLPSFDIVHSLAYGFMHQFFLNLFPNLCRLWQGNFKHIDVSDMPYRIPDSAWSDIGKLSKEATRTIPAQMVRNLPDIFIDRGSYNAESWGFWMVWIAPYLLKNHLPPTYYEHLCLLVDIVKDATALEITTDMLKRIHNNMLKWHSQYER